MKTLNGIEKNNYVEVCIFNSFEEMLCLIINSKTKSHNINKRR